MRLLIASISARTSAGEGSGVKDDRTSTWRGGKASVPIIIILLWSLEQSGARAARPRNKAKPDPSRVPSKAVHEGVRCHASMLRHSSWLAPELATVRASATGLPRCLPLASCRVGKMEVCSLAELPSQVRKAEKKTAIQGKKPSKDHPGSARRRSRAHAWHVERGLCHSRDGGGSASGVLLHRGPCHSREEEGARAAMVFELPARRRGRLPR